MELAVVSYLNPRQNLIIPNVWWGISLHECDLLILTKNNYAYEVEIKISKSDLVADREKKHQHFNNKIKKLYFAIPEILLGYKQYIPDTAGIIVVSENGFCEKIREARVKNSYRWTDEEKYNAARLGTMRIWGLKEKIRKLLEVNNKCRDSKS